MQRNIAQERASSRIPRHAEYGKPLLNGREPRLTLLHTIRTRHPRSIAEFAKLVGRDFKNVRSDVRVLSELGLVESKAGPRLRDAVVLSVPYQRIQFEIAV